MSFWVGSDHHFGCVGSEDTRLGTMDCGTTVHNATKPFDTNPTRKKSRSHHIYTSKTLFVPVKT